MPNFLEILSKAFHWLLTNSGSVISLIVQGFIAYHVFFLSRKLTSSAKLEHKEKIKKRVEELLNKIESKKLNRKVYLVNINRYFKDYPSNDQKRFEGYSHLRADIKSVRFDGIEFFSEMPMAVYQKSNNELTFKKEGEEKFTAHPVGVVPYEWIEHVDLDGDEYAYVPLFYCHFKGRTGWHFWKRLLFFGYPYKRVIFYKERETYHEDDHFEMKYGLIYDPISK